jgi:hypothetical protein
VERIEDSADVAERKRVMREMNEKEELERRSTVIKRGLPRPLRLSATASNLLSLSCLDPQLPTTTPELDLASHMIG